MPITAKDPFLFSIKGPLANSPGTIGVITPSDVDELPKVCRALYCGGTGGDVEVVLMDGSIPPPMPVANGGWIDRLMVRQVRAAGTTATGLVGFI